MALYIKDSSVDHLAEQVRVRLGARTKTDAVRAALQHELQRVKSKTPLRERLAAVRQRAREELGPPVPDIDMKKLMDELWEEGA
ncbi:type II toxin-antitoxin system VapB family antitoxin [Sinorhizobium meliloti]|uniref:type II toxin-antitoxin system VapB family antitoxin n=1 Tax=Rhizobium meliloti TaxID=382 RepID=UPI0030B159E2